MPYGRNRRRECDLTEALQEKVGRLTPDNFILMMLYENDHLQEIRLFIEKVLKEKKRESSPFLLTKRKTGKADKDVCQFCKLKPLTIILCNW